MIEAKASLVASVEAVDHVLYALDVAPIGDVGREARAARWACCPRWRGWWWRLLRLQAACWAARQPGRGGWLKSIPSIISIKGREVFSAKTACCAGSWTYVGLSCQQLKGQTIIFSRTGQF